MSNEKTAPAEMTFDDELKNLRHDQAIMLGMVASLSNFRENHQKQINEFCKKHLDVAEAREYTLVDIIERTRKIK